MNRRSRFGPGLLVAAAFIGPGTVTTATRAGAAFGFTLLWVLLLSIIATSVFQEMAARLGLVTRQGLGEALRTAIPTPAMRVLSIVLVICAIGLGNAAYQAGNIAGAAIALDSLTDISHRYWAVAVGVIAAALLWHGSYRMLERSLIALVGVISLVFVITAVMAKPDLSSLVKGLVTPRLPEGSLTIAIALIGTTVVPYNLFLHASTVCEKWPESVGTRTAIRDARLDTTLAVVLGGIVTLAIMITASAFLAESAKPSNAAGMAQQLEPLLGSFAKVFFSLGLLAAGLTSAITAPLAAAYAMGGAMGWERNVRSSRYRVVWMAVLLIGTSFATLGKSPVEAIVFAQATNGLILPVVAIFLLWVVNKKDLLGDYVNHTMANAVGGLVVAVIASLGFYRLVTAF